MSPTAFALGTLITFLLAIGFAAVMLGIPFLWVAGCSLLILIVALVHASRRGAATESTGEAPARRRALLQ